MELNRYPWWKNLAIALTLLLGVLYAVPNLFGEKPSVQISPLLLTEVNPASLEQINNTLVQLGVPYEMSNTPEQVLIHLNNTTDQLRVQQTLAKQLGSDWVVALNLAPATPEWLTKLGANPMKLGLDLRGGVHFLLEIDEDILQERQLESFIDPIRQAFRTSNIVYQDIRMLNYGLVIRFPDDMTRRTAEGVLLTEFAGLTLLLEEAQGQPALIIKLNTIAVAEMINVAVEQSMTILRNRVNELGVAEAVVQRQGPNRIVVELPGVQDTAYAKDIVGKTASLEFHLVDNKNDVQNALRGMVPAGSQLNYERNGNPVLLEKRIVLTGDSIVGAQSGFDEYGQPSVFIQLGGNARAFSQITRDNIGHAMATVYVETRFEDKIIDGKTERVAKQIEEVISVATIQSALGSRFQITGLSSTDEARNLALLLRAGALPAPIDFVEERTIGPSLGADNIKAGFQSLALGMVLVLLCMILYYRVFGVIAGIALAANLVLLISLLSVLGATLTLPGMAGIVLTLGMAVDANVLIFERIRDELRKGQAVQSCIYAGFEKAFVTILDANITTFIAALALFSLGSGPVKGFAVTLILGLITSIFTAVMVSRALVNFFYGRSTRKNLPIGI